MKTRTLNLLWGLGACLLLAGPAPAAFTGISVDTQPNEFGILTCRVYAEFTNPDDRLLSVYGTPEAPVEIEVVGGVFFQHALGTDRPPSQTLIEVFGSLAFDTFVTIGLSQVDGTDAMMLMPGWPGFGASHLDLTDNGWFVTPGQLQAVPDANGRVLLGQFSTTDGDAVVGRFTIQAVSNGMPFIAGVGFCSDPGAPCFTGDLNLDNMIGIEDFLLLLGCWGPIDGGDPVCVFADGNGNGEVDVVDFLTLLANWTTIGTPPPCDDVDADLNDDGVVDILDLLIWLTCKGSVSQECLAIADIDGNGSIDVNDLVLLLANWGPCP